jgi:hypothetical protein
MSTLPPLPPTSPFPVPVDLTYAEWVVVLAVDGTVLETGGGNGIQAMERQQEASPPELEVVPMPPGESAERIRRWKAYDRTTKTFFYDLNKVEAAGTTIEEIERAPILAPPWWKDAPRKPPRRA